MNWQTIDTAPKDGTAIIVYNKQLEHPMVAQPSGLDCWIEATCGEFYGPATHWMPLPPKPEDAQ